MAADLVPSSNGNGHNGNGHHPGAGGLPAAAASEKVSYTPTVKDRRYLDAVLKLLGEGGRLTNAAIAAAMNPPANERAVQKWRHRHPEVDAWVDEQCRLEAERSRGRVIMRATQLALRGSIDHMNYLAKVGGWFQQTEAPAPGAPGAPVTQINILVPRP